MKHVTFSDNHNKRFKVAILIKEAALQKEQLQKFYVNPLVEKGLNPKDIVALSLRYNVGNKITADEQRAYLDNILPMLEKLEVTTLLVCDSSYYKILAGVRKTEGTHGYVVPCKHITKKQTYNFDIANSVNYQALKHNPTFQTNIDLSIQALVNHLNGELGELGDNVLGEVKFPTTLPEIQACLDFLLNCPVIACDVETTGLSYRKHSLSTIAFAYNETDGFAFAIGRHSCEIESYKITEMLRQFFTQYQGKIIYHNATFDILFLIWNLFLDPLEENYGDFLDGLDIMTRDIEDTKLIIYLATNTCVGNVLGLKPNTHEYLGNYGVDLEDTSKVPLQDLLVYNLKDTLGTFWVYKKYYPQMVNDEQENIYKEIFLLSIKIIVAMEYTGMPIIPERVLEVEAELEAIKQEYLAKIHNNPNVKSFGPVLRKAEWEKKHAEWKTKKVPLEDSMWDEFETLNPNSTLQVADLLYKHIGLPVVDLTKGKQPATGAETCGKLVHLTDDETVKDLLNAFVEYAAVIKILNDFIKRFKEADLHSDGHYYLHGSFKLGGTVSGRLSSANPNMQNLPSGSKYGKLIKSCFASRKGELFAGADFWSLEDRISALTTKDPAKLKVYVDGYDGHCLRAYAYFGHEMPDIDPDDVDSINSIAEKYPEKRQKSKGPTFALTYDGTAWTLHSKSGIPLDESNMIFNNYHELYKVSVEATKAKLKQATVDGYVTVAFGLRVRTPLLARTVLGSSYTPKDAEAEGRTAGNALGQSYGMLNNRAAIEFMNRVWNSEWRTKIRICAMIHDSIYVLLPNNAKAVKWVNDNLTDCMAWQELPEIQHPDVPLGGDLDIFYPNWSKGITLDHDISVEEIKQIARAS